MRRFKRQHLAPLRQYGLHDSERRTGAGRQYQLGWFVSQNAGVAAQIKPPAKTGPTIKALAPTTLNGKRCAIGLGLPHLFGYPFAEVVGLHSLWKQDEDEIADKQHQVNDALQDVRPATDKGHHRYQ